MISPLDYLKVLKEQDTQIPQKIDQKNISIEINLWKLRRTIFKENLKYSILPLLKSYNPFDLTMKVWGENMGLTTPWDRLRYVFEAVFFITKSSFSHFPIGYRTKNRQKVR